MLRDPILDAHTDTLSRYWARGNHAFGLAAILGVALVAMAVSNHRQSALLAQQKPLFVFVDELGRAHPKDYTGLEFDQQDSRFERVVRSSLGQFVQLQFQVRKLTVAEDLPRALLFMTSAKAAPFVSYYRSGAINRLIDSPSQPEVTVEVQNVGLASLTGCGGAGQQPCRAEVEYIETKGRDASPCIVNLTFRFEDAQGNLQKIIVNPLGIAVGEFTQQCGSPKALSVSGR